MIDVRCKKCNKLLFKIQQESLHTPALDMEKPLTFNFIQIKCGRCKALIELPFEGYINASDY